MLAPPILSRYPPLAYPAGRVPGFDPSHPAANGAFLSCVASGANFINVLSGNKGTITGTPVASIIGAIGPGVNTISSSTAVVTFGTITTPANLTMGAIVFPNTLQITNSALLYLDSSTTADILGLINISSVSKWEVTLGTNVGLETSFAAVLGTPYFVAASISSVGTVNFVIMNLQNGQVLTATNLNTYPSLTTVTICVGGRSTTNSRQYNGPIACGMMTSNFMSLPQLLAWAQRPWDFWYPISKANSMGIFG